jgi:hypothetical protein
MLCGGGAFSFGCGFLAVTLVKAIDASRGIDQLLFTRKERVASRTDFYVQVIFLGRACFEGLAASTGNSYFGVFGVNSWFHFNTSSLSLDGPWPYFQT